MLSVDEKNQLQALDRTTYACMLSRQIKASPRCSAALSRSVARDSPAVLCVPSHRCSALDAFEHGEARQSCSSRLLQIGRDLVLDVRPPRTAHPIGRSDQHPRDGVQRHMRCVSAARYLVQLKLDWEARGSSRGCALAHSCQWQRLGSFAGSLANPCHSAQ